MSFSELKKYKLKEVATILTGFPFKGNKYTQEGIRVLRGENVTIGELRWDTIKCWNEPFEQLEKYSLKAGDIVVGMDGSRVGKNRAQICNTDLPLLLAQRVACLRSNKYADQDFLAYIIKSKSFETYVSAVQTGTSIPHISQSQIEEFELELPPLSIQRRGATILSSLDDKIELNRQTNQTLEAIAQALFKEWFVDFNFPGANGEMQESELGEIPKGWKVGKIKDISEVNKNSLSSKDNFKFINYIEISEVNKGVVGNKTKYEFGKQPSRAKRKIKHGDVVLSTVRPDRGSYFLAYSPEPTCIVSTGFAVFSATKVPFSFLYLYLTDIKQLEYYGRIANGGAYPAINPLQIMEISLLIPSIDALTKFHSVIEPILGKIRINQQEIETLAELRDTLLPKLMKGEIPNTETVKITASVL